MTLKQITIIWIYAYLSLIEFITNTTTNNNTKKVEKNNYMDTSKEKSIGAHIM